MSIDAAPRQARIIENTCLTWGCVMNKRVQYVDECPRITVSDLYRHLFGPKGDRLCRFSSDPLPYRLTWQLGEARVEIDCFLVNQQLFIRTSLQDGLVRIPLTSYSQGLFGSSSRLAFRCPSCSRRVFSLFLPPSQGTPILCLHCHGLSYPSWRFGGPSRERALLQRSKLKEKLGDSPAERAVGVSGVRHQRRFRRYMEASKASLR